MALALLLELVDLVADVDAEDALVYMPHRDADMATLGRRMHEIYAQEEGLSWEN